MSGKLEEATKVVESAEKEVEVAMAGAAGPPVKLSNKVDLHRFACRVYFQHARWEEGVAVLEKNGLVEPDMLIQWALGESNQLSQWGTQRREIIRH